MGTLHHFRRPDALEQYVQRLGSQPMPLAAWEVAEAPRPYWPRIARAVSELVILAAFVAVVVIAACIVTGA